MSGFDHPHVLKPSPVRRIEVITGAGSRRKWASDVKADIIMEALAPGAVVSHVARRHDMGPQQLFGWLREARKAAEPSPGAFVPVVVDAPPVREALALKSKPKRRRRRRLAREGGIELEINGVAVRVERGAEAKTVAAVIQALQGSR